jgi:endonuclease/exonuclease/phosphatase family metal-dependent hydrolase
VWQPRVGRRYGNLIAWRDAAFHCVAATATTLDDLADVAAARSASGSTEAAAPHWTSLLPLAPPTIDPPPVDGASAPTDGSSAAAAGGDGAADGTATPTAASRFAKYMAGDHDGELRRACVGLVVALHRKPATSGSGEFAGGLIVGCTHLYFAPHAHVVRMAQTAQMLLCMAEVAAGVMAKADGDAPAHRYGYVLAGDLNTIPGTAPYHYLAATPIPVEAAARLLAEGDPSVGAWNMLAEGALDCDKLLPTGESTPRPVAWLARLDAWVQGTVTSAMALCPFANRDDSAPATPGADDSGAAAASSGAPAPAALPPSDAGGVQLVSAYAQLGPDAHRSKRSRGTAPANPACSACVAAAREPDFTTLTDTFADTLDYVWVGGAAVRVAGVLPTPTAASVLAGGAGGMPSTTHPSDHAPVAADLRWLVGDD